MSSGTWFWKERELLWLKMPQLWPTKIKSLARWEENKQILRSGIHPRFTLAEQSPVSQHKDTADLAVRPKWRSGRAGGGNVCMRSGDPHLKESHCSLRTH